MKSYSSCYTTPDNKAHFETGTIEIEGRTFESGGAMLTPTHAIGYPKMVDGKLVMATWGGVVLGPAKIVSSWKMAHWSPLGGDRMRQIEATIGGRVYTGRGFGVGMLWRGKAKKGGRNNGRG